MNAILPMFLLAWLCLANYSTLAQQKVPRKAPPKIATGKPKSTVRVVAKPKAKTPPKSSAQPYKPKVIKKPTATVAKTPPGTVAPKPAPKPPTAVVNQQAGYDRSHQTQPTTSAKKTNQTRPSVTPSQQHDPETGNDPAFGLKGGLALMSQTTSGQASNNKTGLMGYQGGMFLQIAGGHHFSLQPELNYILKGIRYAFEQDYDQLKTTYVELPVLVKVHLGTGRLTANVFVGPYVGYWLSGKLENQTDGQKTKLNYEFDADKSDGYADNRLDYGAVGGVGVSFSTGSGYILLEGRYQYGLADIVNINPKPDGYVPTYNRGFQASIGYAIKF